MLSGCIATTGGLISRLFNLPPAAAVANDAVAVVRGCDPIDQVLQRLDVPYTEANPLQISDAFLGGVRGLFMGCGGALPAGAPERIAAWVEAGGRLVTSDRMALHLLEAAFRDERGRPLVRHHRSLSTDRTADCYVSEADWEDPAVRYLMKEGERAFWRVRKCSFPVAIDAPERVRVLARSEDLGAVCDGADTVLLRFTYGLGQVLHMTSHWYDQEFGSADEPAASSCNPLRSMVFPVA